MKNILVLLHDDGGQEARLQVALDLTRALDGHLICLDVTQLPIMASGETVFDSGQAQVFEQERTREAANRDRVSKRLAGEDVRWELRETTGDLAQSVTEQAGLADLIVVNRRLDDFFGPEMRSVASTIVLKSHRPVMAVPESVRRFDAYGRALVAWDGSMPVMSAVASTFPLLKLAQSVLLYEIDDGSSAVPAEEAATYLSRHDIHAVVRRVALDGKGVAELIEDGIAANDCAYCVMGAYGHARMRETVFGGVTRHMLGSSPVPLLLAH